MCAPALRWKGGSGIERYDLTPRTSAGAGLRRVALAMVTRLRDSPLGFSPKKGAKRLADTPRRK